MSSIQILHKLHLKRSSQDSNMASISHIICLLIIICHRNMSMKSLIKDFFTSVYQIKGHPYHVKSPNTSEDNRSSFLYCAWCSKKTGNHTCHYFIKFHISRQRGAAFHTQTHKALWILFKHVPLKATVLGFIFFPPGKGPQYLSHKQWTVHASPTKVPLTLFSSNPKAVLCSRRGYIQQPTDCFVLN